MAWRQKTITLLLFLCNAMKPPSAIKLLNCLVKKHRFPKWRLVTRQDSSHLQHLKPLYWTCKRGGNAILFQLRFKLFCDVSKYLEICCEPNTKDIFARHWKFQKEWPKKVQPLRSACTWQFVSQKRNLRCLPSRWLSKFVFSRSCLSFHETARCVFFWDVCMWFHLQRLRDLLGQTFKNVVAKMFFLPIGCSSMQCGSCYPKNNGK